MEELLLGFVSKALNLDNEQLTELLYQKSEDGKPTKETAGDALEKLLSAHSAHVSKIKGEGGGKDRFNEGHSAGKKEALSQLEERLRKEFKTESKATGVDLVKDVVASVVKSELADDKVKVHPLFLRLEQELSEGKEGIKSEYEAKIKALTDEYGRKERFAEIAQPRILEELAKTGAVLPANPKAAARQQMEFANYFRQFDFEPLQTGEVLIKKPDGTRLETPHGHPVRRRR